MANPFIQQQDPEELAILRRQRMAEQLMQQAQQPMEQGQMVSGIYVKPNFTQYLAKGLQQYMGARGVQQADEEAKALYEGRQAQTQADRQKVAELLRPTPAITLPADQQGPVAPEQAADPTAAYAAAMGARDPMLQQFGFTGLANMPAQAEAKAARLEDRAFRQGQTERQITAERENLEYRLKNERMSAKERMAFELRLREIDANVRKQGENKPPMGYRFTPDGSGNLEVIPGGPAAVKQTVQPQYDSASGSFITPPTLENPSGTITPSFGKLGAKKSIDAISKQFLGENTIDQNGQAVKTTGLIDKTASGGLFGYKGVLTSGTQEAKQFDNLREQLSGEMRKVFRIAGEGSLSDADQRQIGIQLPSRDYDAQTNKDIMANIKMRVENAVFPLGMPVESGNEPPPNAVRERPSR
jgi:hypothetical protein